MWLHVPSLLYTLRKQSSFYNASEYDPDLLKY